MDIPHFVGPSMDRYCGVVCTFQPVNNAAVNMGVQICFSLLSVLLVLYPEVGLLDHVLILCLTS